MMRSRYQTLLLGLLAMTVSSGCQTFGTTTVRGQSPQGTEIQQAGIQQTGGVHHTPIRSTADAMHDAYREHHNTDTYYYGPRHHQAAGYQSCPPGGQPGNCPPEGMYGNVAYGNCPPGGYGDCPPGHGHGCQTGLCQDRFSYGYRVPNDLVYPPAGGIGGAVVYPYYTHKGPSDFFRQ